VGVSGELDEVCFTFEDLVEDVECGFEGVDVKLVLFLF
jgi:hypothetical protein